MSKGKMKPTRARLMPMAAAVAEDRLGRLAVAISEVRSGERSSPRTAKLLAAGVPKMAKKVIEEAGEVAIDALRDDKAGVVRESVDLIYNLLILWLEIGVDPRAVWAEMDRREMAFGMAEKIPKGVPVGS